MSSQVQALQKQVTQLRQEASIQRIPVSKAIEEEFWCCCDHATAFLVRIYKHEPVYLLSYMTQNSNVDALVMGVNQSENPFRDQKSCVIL